MSNHIVNTSKQDQIIHLASAMLLGQSASIEHQEAQGQRQFVGSDRLPANVSMYKTAEQKDAIFDELESLGFVIGPIDTNDPIFRQASLPQGWKRVATEHSMWSNIVDELGRCRLAIFYKAAFYDRSAHMSLETVGSYVRSCIDNDEPSPIIYDEKWATPAAVVEGLKAYIKDGDEMCDYYRGEKHAKDEYAIKRLAAWAVKRDRAIENLSNAEVKASKP